ncbi:kinesin-like protein KIF22 [Platysternon megacephalum]|uniref:Kinesin-like protein KIF22 n=1 Tax=Platysternon megacephalum TaxID=55544 RepID=A0A4D9DR11_9SAUR|nr:kinesin-like protein KIF22 [Platysternon megacephalum]
MGNAWRFSSSLQSPHPGSLLPSWRGLLESTACGKLRILQSNRRVPWEGTFPKLFASLYKTPTSPSPPGLHLSVSSVDQRHMFDLHQNNSSPPGSRSCSPHPQWSLRRSL